MEQNLTTGNVRMAILRFSLPYLLSYFLQTLYGMADLFIVGQFNKTASITAVSIGSQVMHMITVMIVGLAMGTTVTVARAVGEGRKEKASDAIGNTITLFAIGSLLLTILLLLCVNIIVSVMSTPAEAASETKQYLIICFLGIPFITAYNVISSVFRGLGDSKSPMCFIAVACASNILLDYLFIGVLSLGPAGAALGTTLSQTISVLVSLMAIRKRGSGLVLKKHSFRPRKNVCMPILRIGFPVAVQDGFIQISFLLITIFANRRGLTDAAAVGIVEKIISIMFLIPSTMLSTVSALAAQNFGAGKSHRARLTLRYAIEIAVAFGIVMTILTQFFAPSIVDLFEEDPAVIAAGAQYLRSYVWDCIFAGVHFCFSGYFCAMERSFVSFLHNIISILLARIPIAYYASLAYPDTLFPMGMAAPVGSLLSILVCLIAYRILSRNFKKTDETL